VSAGPDLIRCKLCDAHNWRLGAHNERYWDVVAATEAGLITGPAQEGISYGVLFCLECGTDDDEMYDLPSDSACPT
jgi:hypothetical protein